MVIKFSWEKIKFSKKTFLAKKPFQIWQKYLWSKSHFCLKTISGWKSIFVQIAISGPKAKSGPNVTSGRKATMMHFEELLTGDDLLALWNFTNSFLSASIYDFMSILKVDESIIVHFFVKMHLYGIDFNSKLMTRLNYG